MKKYIVAILFVVVVLTLAACSKSAISQIYEVDNGSLNIDIYNHTNVISDETVTTYDLPAGQSKVLQICDKTLELSYKYSIYYPLRSHKVHAYAINGTDDGSVLFKEDGSIYAILRYSFAMLEIPDGASAETVQLALKEEILPLVDLSKYDQVETEETHNGYRLHYTNEVYGYKADYVGVSVKKDGSINALWIRDLELNAEELCAGIDKSAEEELLNVRLQNIYNAEDMKYLGYSFSATPMYSVYENELYVEYALTCRLYNSAEDYEDTDECRLLIPIRLLSGE